MELMPILRIFVPFAQQGPNHVTPFTHPGEPGTKEDYFSPLRISGVADEDSDIALADRGVRRHKFLECPVSEIDFTIDWLAQHPTSFNEKGQNILSIDRSGFFSIGPQILNPFRQSLVRGIK